MLVTQDEGWAKKAKYLTTQAKDDAVEYIHCEIGYNYRLTNLQAAVGCAQLEQLDQFVSVKRRLAGRYRMALEPLPSVHVMSEAPWATSSFWLSTIRLDPTVTKIDRQALRRMLGACHIETRPLWQPLHRSPAHRGAQAYHCMVADRIQEQALSLPSSANLTDAEQDRVIKELRTALSSPLQRWPNNHEFRAANYHPLLMSSLPVGEHLVQLVIDPEDAESLSREAAAFRRSSCQQERCAIWNFWRWVHFLRSIGSWGLQITVGSSRRCVWRTGPCGRFPLPCR